MSYDILYRARFIKYQDKLIPLVETGSNNCYEWNNKKRARDGWSWRLKVGTEQEILNDLEVIRQNSIKSWEEYKDDSFAYYTALRIYGKYNTTYKDFVNFFKRAIKNAKTIEEWGALGVQFCMALTYTGQKKYEAKEIENINTKFITEESELDEFINNSFVLLSSYGEEKKSTNHRVKKRVTVDKFYTLKTPMGYFVKNTRYGYKYSLYGHAYSKKFKTQSEAKRAKKDRDWDIIEVMESATI